jgi:phospholipase/carboxylesterase
MQAGDHILWAGEAVAKAQVICVFVHGRGQSPEDMQASVIDRLSVQGVAFALPRAASKSWYAARAVDALTDKTRRELASSLDQLRSCIAAVRAVGPGKPILLAGFSQGACLSIEHVASGADRPDALAAFTGCRVGHLSDARPSVALRGLPVYMTGADADSWIPVTAFADAFGELGGMGARIRADLFPGRAHEVSDLEISVLASMLGDLGAGRAPAMQGAVA